MTPLIEKLMAIREDTYKSITTHYGRDARLKTKLVIATRNITWRRVDVDKCAESGIAIITDDELEYYKSLIRYLKQAARYQLLAHLFGGTGIRGLAKQVAATQGTMGGRRFYNFLIQPDELLKIAYIGHRSSRNIDNIETYQRLLQPKRLKEISEYIKKGGKFPTNIVVNIITKNKKGLKFDRKEKVGNESYGILHLPAKYAAAWIIDGQHRLYGPKKDLVLMDNNVVASARFKDIIAEIRDLGFTPGAKLIRGRVPVQRRVDFNQGVDARILCRDPMYLRELSTICKRWTPIAGQPGGIC